MHSPVARWRPRALAGALFVVALVAPARGDAPPAPLPAQPSASGEARLATAPIRIEIPEGERKAFAMGSVAPGHDAEFLFSPPRGAMLAVGVSSKSGEARLSIYAADGNEELPGTRRESGAIRWIGAGPDGKDLRIVVHTKSQESPVRVEVSIEAPAQEAPAVE